MELEHFSDEVLVDLFPHLDLESVHQLSLVDLKFARLFEEESHWKTRVENEFPGKTHCRSSLDWRNYYRFLKTNPYLPVYYHGDIIDWAPFNKSEVGVSLALIRLRQPSEETVIIFVSDSVTPILLLKEKLSVHLIDQDVKKIVFVESFHLNEGEDLYELIFKELTSPLGRPPIYGLFIYGPEERELIIFDRRVNNELIGIGWSRLLQDRKTEIFELFGLTLPESIRESEKILEEALLKIGHLL